MLILKGSCMNCSKLVGFAGRNEGVGVVFDFSAAICDSKKLACAEKICSISCAVRLGTATRLVSVSAKIRSRPSIDNVETLSHVVEIYGGILIIVSVIFI